MALCCVCKYTAYDPSTVAGRWGRCRPCYNAYQKQWRIDNAARFREIQRLAKERRYQFSESIRDAFRLLSGAIRSSIGDTKFKVRYATSPEYRERRKGFSRRYAESHPEVIAKKNERQRRRAADGVGEIVYFIRGLAGGPIKIGHTSRNPEYRLRNLHVATIERYQIIGVMFGSRSLESDLHYRFRDLRINGEWFHDEPELLGFIQDNAIPWSVTDVRQEAERVRVSQAQEA